jgi:hypothetical protein
MSTPKGLAVADQLTLPYDAVTQTFALLAVRRAGKSNAAAVMAEKMHEAGLPWVAIDPKGDWWGLRSSADGKGAGLPIPIFGGLHGDMPLVPESGRLMAELIVEHNLTCILDVSRFSKAARVRFLTAFAERLYELHQADPQPRHLFLEEADRVVPQKFTADMAPCVGAFSDIVRLGGSFGLGATLISQRSAVINKDVLTQVETMIALRTTSPQDRKVIRDWMEHHAITSEIVDSLPGLLSGEAWVSSSFFLTEHGQDAIQRIRFRRRSTFDSGATPAVGQQRKVATLADIDLPGLETRLAAVVEKAAYDDPKTLRRRIAELERQARTPAGPSADAARLTAEKTALQAELAEALAKPPVEVPVLQPGEIAAFEQAITGLRDLADGLQIALSRATQRPAPAPRPAPAVAPAPVRAPAAPARPALPAGEGPPLSKAHRAILTVLAQFPGGRTITQIAMLTGYSSKGGGFRNALGALRTAGYIGRGEPVLATPEGLAALGDAREPLPEGPALLEHWAGQLGKAEALILRVVVAAWPESIARTAVAEQTGYAPDGGGFRNALGRLRTLLLISGQADLIADETLAQQVQGSAVTAGA